MGIPITKHRECNNHRVHRLMVRVADNSVTTPNTTTFFSDPNSNSKLHRNALPLFIEGTLSVNKRGKRERNTFLALTPLSSHCFKENEIDLVLSNHDKIWKVDLI